VRLGSTIIESFDTFHDESEVVSIPFDLLGGIVSRANPHEVLTRPLPTKFSLQVDVSLAATGAPPLQTSSVVFRAQAPPLESVRLELGEQQVGRQHLQPHEAYDIVLDVSTDPNFVVVTSERVDGSRAMEPPRTLDSSVDCAALHSYRDFVPKEVSAYSTHHFFFTEDCTEPMQRSEYENFVGYLRDVLVSPRGQMILNYSSLRPRLFVQSPIFHTSCPPTGRVIVDCPRSLSAPGSLSLRFSEEFMFNDKDIIHAESVFNLGFLWAYWSPYHWLTQLFPRILLWWEEAMADERMLILLPTPPPKDRARIDEALDLLGVPQHKRLFCADGQLVHADVAWFSSYTTLFSAAHECSHGAAEMQRLRTHVLRRLALPLDSRPQRTVLLIQRDKHLNASRRIGDFDAVQEELIARLAELDVEPRARLLVETGMATLTLEAQVRLFAPLLAVISLHGAALSHIVWMARGSHVLEIFTPSSVMVPYNVYFRMARNLGLQYWMTAQSEGDDSRNFIARLGRIVSAMLRVLPLEERAVHNSSLSGGAPRTSFVALSSHDSDH
jgi:hypothetical protein